MGSSRKPKSTRAGSARSVKPSPKSRPEPALQFRLKTCVLGSDLADIRRRLALAMAVTYVTSAALKGQEADSDAEAALVLQRFVGDELDRQIERLDALTGRCRERKS